MEFIRKKWWSIVLGIVGMLMIYLGKVQGYMVAVGITSAYLAYTQQKVAPWQFWSFQSM